MIKVMEEYPDIPFELIVGSGQKQVLNLASFKQLKTCNFSIKVCKDASFEFSLADFSSGDGKVKIEIFLDEGATAIFHLASLSKGNDKKVFDVSATHLAPHSNALISNYGITRDKSKLTFTGTSKINNGSYASVSRQEAKIIVFDETCDGKCSPILKIDENDVSASHAASVGKLNDDHLYYLLSRGISLEEAKKLITFGYLKPIIQYFSSIDLKKKIEDSIEEVF